MTVKRQKRILPIFEIRVAVPLWMRRPYERTSWLNCCKQFTV